MNIKREINEKSLGGIHTHWAATPVVQRLALALAWLLLVFDIPSVYAQQSASGKNGLIVASSEGERSAGRPGGEAADELTPEQLESQVRSLLRELEADQLKSRDAAEQSLIELGPRIMRLLPDITPRTSGEQKIRLQRIRQALSESKIEAFFEASYVTLEGEMTLAEAIESIQQQTGNAIDLTSIEGMQEQSVVCNYEHTPFWTAIYDLMWQAELQINTYGTTTGELVLGRARGVHRAQPVAVGPFSIQPNSVQSSLQFASQLEGQLGLSLLVAWEPRLKPIFMQVPMDRVMLTLDNGEQLTATNPQAKPEITLNLGNSTTQVDYQMQRAPRSATTIAQLTGQFSVAIPSERHQYEFENFGSGARQSEKYGDVTVTLEGTRRNGSVYETRILTAFGDAQGALESYRSWILSNEAYLLDKNGNRLEHVSLQTYAMRPNGVGIAYMFQINSDPDNWKLVYESPASMTTHTVEFELNDIPLP
jgi:hypothetical protein